MSPPSQPPRHLCGCGPASTLHMSLAAVGSSPDTAGRLDGTEKMHGCLHMCKGLTPHAGLEVGVR